MKNKDCEFQSIAFAIYTPEEVRKISVKEIKSYIAIEPTLGKGALDGLYDSKLGTYDEKEPCVTCNLSFSECNGHFGRIEFPRPIFNPALFGALFKLIKGVCFYCHRFNKIQGMPETLFALGLKSMEGEIRKYSIVDELKSLSKDAIVDRALKLISQSKKESSKCSHCGKVSLLFNKSRKAEILVHITVKKVRETEEPESKKRKVDLDDIDEKPIMNEVYTSPYSAKQLYGIFRKEEVVFLPEILREHMRYLWINEHQKLKLILPFLSHNINFKFPTDAFFMENMLVNPPMNRVPAIRDGCKLTESSETTNLSNVIRSCMGLRSLLENQQPDVPEELQFQNMREGVLDIQQRVNVCLDMGTHRNLTSINPGLRQMIDKKSGLFRQNIQAKRVNFSCRSVISPDPNIGLDEIGVPIIFLKRLQFAEPLNEMNREFLIQCILNGPEKYPGAIGIQIDDRNMVKLKEGREANASHMDQMWQGGHRVTVYRHAMDGDYLIMNRQPTLHRPSMQGHKIKAIVDPNAKTLRMHYSNCKAYNADFDGDEMNGHYMQSVLAQTEAKVIVGVANQHSTPKDGSPLAGLIQDHVIAGTRMCMRNCFLERHEYFDLVKNGLQDNYISPLKLLPPAIMYPKRLWTGKQVLSTIIINSIPEEMEMPNIVLLEPKKSKLWNVSSTEEKLKLSDVDLVICEGYVCTGMFDKVHIGPSQKGLISDLRELYGNERALQVLTNLSRGLNRYLIYTGFSTDIKDGFLNQNGEDFRRNTLSKIKSMGLISIENAFNLDKSERTMDKVVQMMEKAQFDKSDDFKDKCAEIDVDFKCLSIKYMNCLGDFCKENLRDSFPKNNLSFMCSTGAKGNDSNTKKIAIGLGAIEIEGKRTKVTISGRTLPSFKRYDFDPFSRGFCKSRFSTGLNAQELFFESMAGRDGLVDTAVKTSSSGYLQRCLIKSLEDVVVRHDGTVRDNMDNIIQFKYGYDGLDVIKSIGVSNIGNMEVLCRNLDHFKKRLIEPTKKALMNVGEADLTKTDMKNMADLVKKMESEQVPLTKKDKKLLVKIIATKMIMARCEAGDAVGLVAAQSIGEPSTQMTLNTFHNAGQSEMNVTLGIPRLREILMTGSENIKTPSMSVPIIDITSSVLGKVMRKFNKFRLKDVFELPLKLEVEDNYVITFKLKKYDSYKHLTNLTVPQIIKRVEGDFFKKLGKTIKQYLASSNIEITADEKEVIENEEDDNLDEDKEDADEDIIVTSDNNEEGGRKRKRDDDDFEDDECSEATDDDDEDKENGNKAEDSDSQKDNEENELDDALGQAFSTRIKAVLSYSEYFVNYAVDSKASPRWIKLTIKNFGSEIDVNSLLLNLIQVSVISRTDGIQKALMVKNDKGNTFCTEGYNHLELFKYDDVFDLNKFHTNNIVKISKLYGIEAAISSYEHEIKNVFAPYGIEVSNRHLRLIAEYLTSSGETKAFNRHSLKFHSSQLQRSSFETALDTLNDMLIKASVDHLKSPTSNLLLGQVVNNLGCNSTILLADF